MFDANGNVTKNTAAMGKPEQQVSSFFYTRNRQLDHSIDPLNRKTKYEYDANGNLTKVTRLADTANAVSVSATYGPTSSKPLTVTDANGLTTTLGYDLYGNLTTIKDPLAHTVTLGYNSQGQLTSVKNALNRTTTLGYSGTDLSFVSDPLSRQTQYLTDAAGRRVMTVIDPIGNRAYQRWDSMNRLVQVTDALGGAGAMNGAGRRHCHAAHQARPARRQRGHVEGHDCAGDAVLAGRQTVVLQASRE